MWIYWVLAVTVGALVLLSSGTEIKQDVPRYRYPFRKGAAYLAEKLPVIKRKADTEKEIAKLETMLLLLTAGLLFLPFVEYAAGRQEKEVISYQLERPDKGQGSNVYYLNAQIQNESETEQIRLELQERNYTQKEQEKFLEKAKQELEKTVLGENKSVDEVYGKIILPTELQEGEVTVQWIQEPSGLLDTDGNVREELPENGKVLNLTAVLTCGEKEELYEMALHLYPQKRTREEQLRYDLNSALEKEQQESAEKSRFLLPRKVDGKKIIWTKKESSVTEIGLILLILMSAGGYIWKGQSFKKEEEARKRQMLLDYPDVVFQLGMLLNAGLTIQNAFTRIAQEYQEMKRQDSIRWAYEEMVIACNEMKSGIPEAKAYERFGRRCEHTCYIRLGTILSGSLQKSSEGMTELLLEESKEAMEERRQLAKKMGEEAGTKLLFPMILMLLVVLIILIVPAIMSF